MRLSHYHPHSPHRGPIRPFPAIVLPAQQKHVMASAGGSNTICVIPASHHRRPHHFQFSHRHIALAAQSPADATTPPSPRPGPASPLYSPPTIWQSTRTSSGCFIAVAAACGLTWFPCAPGPPPARQADATPPPFPRTGPASSFSFLPTMEQSTRTSSGCFIAVAPARGLTWFPCAHGPPPARQAGEPHYEQRRRDWAPQPQSPQSLPQSLLVRLSTGWRWQLFPCPAATVQP